MLCDSMNSIKYLPYIFLGSIILIVGVFVFTKYNSENTVNQNIFFPTHSSPPTVTPYQFPYSLPQIPKNQSYRIVIVGDSIVASLGSNANTLREKLIEYYPENEFVTYNYGYSSTNIESLPKRLQEETENNEGEKNVAILKQGFELIIIESFGYNPLSELPLTKGLQKQNEILEESVRLILQEKPNVALLFLTPIAPSEEKFGQGTLDLSPTKRKEWVDERNAYITNHKKFAEKKGIPVIDVYTASLVNGSVDLDYVSDDFIHPSESGRNLISQEIADYIFENEVFPK